MPASQIEKFETLEEYEVVYEKEFSTFFEYACAMFERLGLSRAVAGDRAEEATQEMFLTAWRERERIKDHPCIRGWMYDCLKKKIKEIRRADQRWLLRLEMACQLSMNRPSDSFTRTVELESVLEREDFELLRLLYDEGYTYEELCARFGLKKSALAMRIKRAKERFEKEFGDF